MPELPEVETYRRYFDATSMEQRITDISCADERLLKQPFNDFREHLIGQSFTATERIGKYLFARTSGEKILVLHFGMTGNLAYYHESIDRPRFAHIVYHFEGGYNLGFLNKRKFGWNNLTDDINAYQRRIGLSTDATKILQEDFLRALSRRKTAIKPALLDQKVTAGIGNWLADEILYQSRVHPGKKVPDLKEDEQITIYNNMRQILETSIAEQAIYRNFPKNYFIHIREVDATCHHTGVPVEKIKVGGRATYFSPKWQQL
jgi:formamidopyrimidine-DNA glycosylase